MAEGAYFRVALRITGRNSYTYETSAYARDALHAAALVALEWQRDSSGGIIDSVTVKSDPPAVDARILCPVCAREDQAWGTWGPLGMVACVRCRDAGQAAATKPAERGEGGTK